MRILLSIHHLPVRNAGAPGVTLRIAEELVKLGHTADVLSMADMGIAHESVSAQLRYPWFAWSRLKALQDRYDVFDLSTGDGWIYERKRKPGGPLVVVRSHGLEHIAHQVRLEAAKKEQLKLSWKYPLYHGGYRLWEVAQSLRRADMTFFLNHGERAYSVARLGVPREGSRVIDNGIADGFLGLPLPARPERSGLRIVMLGSFEQRKVHDVPAVLDRLLQRHRDWQVGLLGTSVDDSVVRERFSPSVQQRLAVMRRYDNETLPELLQHYDVMLFPSLFEGSPLSPFEGMACGVALVASSLPGLTDRLVDGKEALFVPPGDYAAMEQTLERLASDRDLLETLQREGYQRAQDFSWARVARDTESLYEEGLRTKTTRM